MEPLPIDPHLSEIVSALKTERAIVVSAPPGAGKTTRIPRALYDAGFANDGEILILEPRRLAARLSATRVAQEFGEKIGDTVGYSIRFESVSGPNTRIRFLTEAILARQMVRDPNLENVSTVILDEFHERHLANDLAIAFLRQLQLAKPDLRIVVMSATLDVEPVCSFLEAHPFSISGSPFDISIEYEERASERSLHERVGFAVSRLCRSRNKGDILVFLPGSAEIRRSAEALQPIARQLGLDVFPLHGDLPLAEQKRAIDPAERRKVILATNVAETSITIPGIAAVIDSGLARTAGHSPWSGFPTLSTTKIAKASAIQRAGRAGRTQAGQVFRLYTRADFDSRPEYEIPEIRRVDLAETALLLHGTGIRDLRAFAWYESPAQAALEAAEILLRKLCAIDAEGRITSDGNQMLHLPVHPRLAKLIIEGIRQNLTNESVLLAALLSERDIRLSSRTSFNSRAGKIHTAAAAESDLLELLDSFHSAEESGFDRMSITESGLDPGAVQAVRKGRQQLQRLLSIKASPIGGKARTDDEGLRIAILASFPDRVFKRRKPNSRDLLMAEGGVATLSNASAVHTPMFGVAVDAEEQRDPSRKDAGITVRLASAVDIDWLAALFPEEISEKKDLVWNERGGRVEEYRRTSYGQVSLEEQTVPAAPSEAASKILESAVWERQLKDLRDADSLPALQARLSVVARCFPGENIPLPGDPEIRAALRILCRGKTRLEDLSEISLPPVLLGALTDRQRALVNREVPERIKLKGGRAVKIHYESGKPPWIESRLQDFFGMSASPSICSSQVPLTVHLLAPNGRAVQVTSDLAGFWKKHYPSIRKELQRRYPKHAWPEL
jgi:ATP-dependent helicase HrpB